MLSAPRAERRLAPTWITCRGIHRETSVMKKLLTAAALAGVLVTVGGVASSDSAQAWGWGYRGDGYYGYGGYCPPYAYYPRYYRSYAYYPRYRYYSSYYYPRYYAYRPVYRPFHHRRWW